MKIENIVNNTYIIKGHTNIGVYKINDHDVYLIDTGFGPVAASALTELLRSENLNVLGIINTHSHIDHIGGNEVIQKEFGAKVYISDLERGMVENTLIEPSCLTGSKPGSFIMKYWSAGNSKTTSLNELSTDFEIIDLSGHSAGLIGVMTKDNVLFYGDALINPDKIKVGYIYDIKSYKDTILNLKNIEANYYVGSHTDVANDITKLIEKNLNSVINLENYIINIAKEISFEEILSKVFDKYEMEFNILQYYMVGTTIKSYLSYLVDTKKLAMLLKDNKVLYTKAQI